VVGVPHAGQRLHLIATLRAAAPWQRLRRSEAGGSAPIQVRKADFHVRRHAQRRGTATLFAVDASGSQALHRLAEAKGAVELMLAECYVRRDEVALIAFRGPGAEVLLPPTRSLVRAKRALAGLPGGGGTPLAAGIEAAARLAQQVRRGGATPVVVLLTDGRANVARNGEGGRAQAQADALLAARWLRAAAVHTLLVDTSPRPEPAAAALALAMGARYLALPLADASGLARAVSTALLPLPQGGRGLG
jgi:magnesium chelatase subunit D